ncbi:MAG: hypothetical protein LAO76_16820 [Acidobacteriia bacterium]|nr:hypothetical protein [Terriglobia bacterium]
MANIQRRELMKGILAMAGAMAMPTVAWADQSIEGQMMDIYRLAGVEASHHQLLGGFPTFCTTAIGSDPLTKGDKVIKVFLIKPEFDDWKDVALTALGNPPLNDFAGRMRAAHDYATAHGYLAGFPNYFDAPTGLNGTRVCGTILIKKQPNPSPITLTNLSLAELGVANMNDTLGLFTGIRKYCALRGFAAGYPNMHHANLSKTMNHEQIVCGVVLFRESAVAASTVTARTSLNMDAC